MSEKKRMKKTFKKVRLLSLATPQARKELIRKGDREFVDSVCECCLNVLKGNVPLNSQEKSKLRKHKNELRKLIKKRVSLKKKKEIIQKGGFLGALLGPLLGRLFL